MLQTSFSRPAARYWGKRGMSLKREKLEVTVAGRIPTTRFRTLDSWCTRSLRKRSEVVGLVVERVLEIYEQEAQADEPIEHFIRRLHLVEPP